MSSLNEERVLRVHHWNDSLFSFMTTRNTGFRFRHGQFVMIGVEVDGRPLLRAFSMVSANYDEHLEFYSIKIADGALTSRLQHVGPGHPILIGRKPTGTLLVENLSPGRHLYLLATGTGLAPFLSIVRDPSTYERFERVVLVHGVRRVSDLGYRKYLEEELPRHELVGPEVKKQLSYYPTVTREAFQNRGRLTDLIVEGGLFRDLGLAPMTPERDRAMICGSPSMLRDVGGVLEARGFELGSSEEHGSYLIERAFVEK
jgi:ferredoxin/flavodoxin---NADP+ reductase